MTWKRFWCWLRLGHKWKYYELASDDRVCKRCGLTQYPGFETEAGEKTWISN